MKARVVAAAGIVAFLTGAGLTVAAGSASADTPEKVFVCKFVSKPGVAERLQTGQNPISVSVNAIPVQPVILGAEFADAQGRSVVIAFDTGQPEPSVSACVPKPCPPKK